jgi:multidrug efflux system membrane fusion protein
MRSFQQSGEVTMASAIFKPSRVIAVVLVAAAGLWVLSGHVLPHADEAATETAKTPAAAAPQAPVQKVAVATVAAQTHSREVVLSCTTEADQRASASARDAGIIDTLKVDRGTAVRAGDVIAQLTDEGRAASLKQAQSLLEQRQAEFKANKQLIDKGDAPRNNLPALQAGVAAAEAAVSAAQAELDKATIRSPVDGIVDAVPVKVGQAVQVGADIADIIGPDPMLAVGAVSEARRGQLQTGQKATVRFIDNSTVSGTVKFIGLSGDKATRTYRVEASFPNPDASIADGVSCEMSVSLEPVVATSVPRSALVFSDAGVLGVRIADGKSQVRFMPVKLVDDGREAVWVTGLENTSRVIVVGQDFVKEGDSVEAVSAAQADTKAEPPA